MNEIRDTTGNVLRPGMFGYEQALVKRGTVSESTLPRCKTTHYQTGKGTLCSLDNDAAIRTHTEDKATVTCGYCINLLEMKAVSAPPLRGTPRNGTRADTNPNQLI